MRIISLERRSCLTCRMLPVLTGVNYRLEPWTYREDEGCELGNMFTPCVAADSDPATPTLKAHAGDKVMINVFGAHNEQNQMFNLDGHQWRRHMTEWVPI